MQTFLVIYPVLYKHFYVTCINWQFNTQGLLLHDLSVCLSYFLCQSSSAGDICICSLQDQQFILSALYTTVFPHYSEFHQCISTRNNIHSLLLARKISRKKEQLQQQIMDSKASNLTALLLCRVFVY